MKVTVLLDLDAPHPRLGAVPAANELFNRVPARTKAAFHLHDHWGRTQFVPTFERHDLLSQTVRDDEANSLRLSSSIVQITPKYHGVAPIVQDIGQHQDEPTYPNNSSDLAPMSQEERAKVLSKCDK